MESKIRQPIVTVAGHVDHGKTSILDSIRCSSVADCEAGAITQKISFTKFPIKQLKQSCPLIEKSGIDLDIPGFLFIDTPGHAAFSSLRSRGGSLADLAVLVIDINEGIKPQTAEVIQILKANKTPFVIALNKIDRISGWSKLGDNLKESIEMQPPHIKQEFEDKFYTLIGALNSYGFNGELYYKITDFTKNIAMVPCSAKTLEGLSELLMMLCGLSQKFLKEQLALGEKAKGVVLEIKKEKCINQVEAILYDGSLKLGDEIAIASFNEPIFTKIKAIHEIQNLSDKFTSVNTASASSGIRLQITNKENILPGMPFMTFDNKEEVKEAFKEEVSESIKTDKKGIIIKADSLGSLEALITLLKQSGIKFVKAGIGNINKSDILSAKANLKIDPIDAMIVGFNVDIDEDAGDVSGIKVLTEEVVYKLIENLQKFREEKAKEIERERLMGLAKIAKLEILHEYVFRNTSPAIFGVKIVGGKVNSGMNLIDDSGEDVGRVKNIQADKKSVNESCEGMEVAISVPGSNYERKIKDKKFLYSNLGEKQFKKFKDNKDLLSSAEISVLKEIADIKRKKQEDWGR